jgi:L-threonine O-3-phosphate decarboxylase (EC 4.1.1.81)
MGGRSSAFIHGGSTWAKEVPLDFSDNSNPLGPPPEVEEALRLAAERGVHRRFPAHLVEEVLAEYEGVEVTVFNGATDALLHALLDLKPRRLVVPWPSYGDYLRLAELLGVAALKIPPWRLEAVRPGDVVVLANPNNPLGYHWPRDAVLDYADQLRRRGAKLLVDESFLDFARGETAAPEIPVAKSYGKFLAAPGLRLGALLYRHRAPPPWRINSMADYAVYAAGASALRRHRERTLQYLAQEKPRFEAALKRCAAYLPSAVHFYTVLGPPPPGIKSRPLLDKGVQGFRVSLKNPQMNDLLTRAICKNI